MKTSAFLLTISLIFGAKFAQAAKPAELNQRQSVGNDVQLLIIAARTKALVAGKRDAAQHSEGCRDVRIGNVSTDRYSTTGHETPENVIVTAPIINVCRQ